MNKKVNVLLVTYNRLNKLKETLKSVINQTVPICRILVVDNASNDGTKDWLITQINQNEKINALFLPENLGGAGGFFYGLKWLRKYASSEYIWIMDDDACPYPDTLEILLKASDRLPHAVGFFPAVYMRSGKPEKYSWPRKRFSPGNLFPLPSYSINEIQSKKNLPVEVGAFLGFLIKQEILNKIGLPRPEFFLFFDDFEYTWRISKKFPLYFIPEAKIKHHEHPPQLQGLKSYYLFRNWTYLAKVYGGYGIIRCFLFWLKWKVGISFLRKQHISSYWAFKGILDGLKGRLGKLTI